MVDLGQVAFLLLICQGRQHPWAEAYLHSSSSDLEADQICLCPTEVTSCKLDSCWSMACHFTRDSANSGAASCLLDQVADLGFSLQAISSDHLTV